MESKSTEELLALLGAAWDGQLDESSFQRLEQLLAQHGDQACDILVDFSRFQVELAQLAASSAAHERAISQLQSRFTEASTVERSSTALPNNSAASIKSIRHAPNPRLRVSRRALACAAAVLLPLAAICWLTLRGNPANQAVIRPVQLVRAPYKIARLVAVDEAKWADGARRSPGDLFAENDRLSLLEGTAQISLAFGADILLQAPCTVQIDSASRVHLEDGKLTAQVAPWAKGFEVDAQGLQVTDLGTRFAVWAKSPGEAEAHVLEGAVRAESIAVASDLAPASQTLKAGQAVRWNRADQSLQSIPADASRFVSTLEQFHPLHLINMADTGRGLPVGSRDPGWKITAGHASAGSFPVQANIENAHPIYLQESADPRSPKSDRDNSRWISVRGGVTRGVPAHAVFTFETSFDLTGIDPQTAHLMGQILVDSRVQEIRLNGKPLPIPPFEVYSTQDFRRFHVIEIAEGFVDGLNRVEIDVVNGAVPDGSVNPMALRVEWKGFGRVEL